LEEVRTEEIKIGLKMKPNTPAVPPTTSMDSKFAERSQGTLSGPTMLVLRPSGPNEAASTSHQQKLQNSSVRPLQEVCDQSVVSVQIEDSRVSEVHRRKLTTEQDCLGLETSGGGENI